MDMVIEGGMLKVVGLRMEVRVVGLMMEVVGVV